MERANVLDRPIVTVGAMLEMARAFSQGKCSNRNTIIFVAFDLEEFGSQVRMLN